MFSSWQIEISGPMCIYSIFIFMAHLYSIRKKQQLHQNNILFGDCWLFWDDYLIAINVQSSQHCIVTKLQKHIVTLVHWWKMEQRYGSVNVGSLWGKCNLCPLCITYKRMIQLSGKYNIGAKDHLCCFQMHTVRIQDECRITKCTMAVLSEIIEYKIKGLWFYLSRHCARHERNLHNCGP